MAIPETVRPPIEHYGRFARSSTCSASRPTRGDHKVHVLDVEEHSLTEDPGFPAIDFDTAFSTGPARPHGIGFK